jgi:6-phosphogluconolactonase
MQRAIALVLLLGAMLYTACVRPTKYWVYIGTYTDKTKSKGIYAYSYDPSSSKLEPHGVAAEVSNPSFLALSPNHQFLYALDEVSDGAVNSYSVDLKTGALKFLNTASHVGNGPCHLVVDQTGKTVLVANYGKGSVASLSIEADGRVGAPTIIEHTGKGVNPARQEGPHAHETILSPDNRFVFVPDLGIDQVKIYRFDPAKSSLAPSDPAFVSLNPGSGPRHIAFHPNGKFAYVVSELTPTVTVFSYNASTGDLKTLQTIPTLTPPAVGESDAAEIEVDVAGRFLYVSNRGDSNTISVFSINADNGTLAQAQIAKLDGKGPRFFVIDPSGKFLFVGDQLSDQVESFAIDSSTGKLTATGDKLAVPAPAHILFVPAA